MSNKDQELPTKSAADLMQEASALLQIYNAKASAIKLNMLRFTVAIALMTSLGLWNTLRKKKGIKARRVVINAPP
jgi:hypothetical protein